MKSAPSITVLETIYHRQVDEQPKSYEHHFVRNLQSDEQAYGPRLITLGEKWQSMDCGWLTGKSIGLLIIENCEGRGLQRVPTEEQKVELAQKVVEISHYSSDERDDFIPMWLVPPGEQFKGYPDSVEYLRIRCRKGEAKVKITLIPA